MTLRSLALSASLTASLAAAWPTVVQARPELVEQSLRDPARRYVPQQVLVQFRPGTDRQALASALAVVGGKPVEAVRRPPRGAAAEHGPLLVSVRPGLAMADAVRALMQLEAVEFAEPNWVYERHANATDPHYVKGTLWGMYGPATRPAHPWGSQAGTAASNDCSSVWVGLIDTGYMLTHEDLAANVGRNPGEIPGNGIDDDRNGFVDDVHGWDFLNNDPTVFDGLADNHGTHVAGVIGAVGGNGKGMAGICWKVKLIAAKFDAPKGGGTTANAIRAVDYITDLKKRHGLNLVATSNAWGSGGYSRALSDAIERANAAGILFVTAAGNRGLDIDVTPSYPSSYPHANIISVAAIDSTGRLASFSSFGRTSVDLCAPGVSVRSTTAKLVDGAIVSHYTYGTGTSFAVPFVTGAAALHRARHPHATAAQTKEAILGSVVPTPSCDGKTVTGGRLNIGGF